MDVRPARPQDLEPARALLRAAGLPLDGVEAHWAHYRALDAPGGTLAGVVGSERYDGAEFAAALADAGLVAVDIRETHRAHKHAGSAIVRARKPAAR
jgi:hypothetical protein